MLQVTPLAGGASPALLPRPCDGASTSQTVVQRAGRKDPKTEQLTGSLWAAVAAAPPGPSHPCVNSGLCSGIEAARASQSMLPLVKASL